MIDGGRRFREEDGGCRELLRIQSENFSACDVSETYFVQFPRCRLRPRMRPS